MTIPIKPVVSKSIGLKLVLSVLLVLSAISLLALQIQKQHLRLQESQQRVTHTLEVQAVANELMLIVADGSNAIRGYVISGDPIFLAPFQVMREQLVTLTLDNPVQQGNKAHKRL